MILVYQSYRTQNVPDWITTCLRTVRHWAKINEFDYKFIDDEIFDLVPSWYYKKVKGNVQLVTDLARLVLAKKFLEDGYETVVWIDADLLIFDPERMDISTAGSFSFCLETWVDQDLEGKVVHQRKVNNSISVFKKQNSFLNFYHDACLKMVESRRDLEPVTVGTEFLTALHSLVPLPLLKTVGILSPALFWDIVHGESRFIDPYLEWQGSSIAAINLCGSKIGEQFKGTVIDEESISLVAGKLLNDKLFAI